MLNLVMFCEARADSLSAAALIDRVIAANVDWIVDLVDRHPEAVRVWQGDGDGHAFFDTHRLHEYVERLRVVVPQGRFNGQPGADSAAMARTAFYIARALAKRGEKIDGVVLVSDMDDEPGARRTGLHQARDEARRWEEFRIVVGMPNAKREAWVLAGFEPVDEEERAQIEELRQELGFAPHRESHLLDAQTQTAKRSAKRVVRILTGGAWEREERCWRETPLEVLHARGEHNGLRQFLDEVREHLVPLLETSVVAH